MRIGIFAKTFPGSDPLAVLGAAAEAGYAAVQYNMACSGLGALPESIADGAADAVRAASRQTGVALAAISATYNMIDPVPARREAGRRSFAAIAAQAGRMGARLITVCTGSRDPEDRWRHHPDNAGPAAWADLIAEFGRILPLAERHDVLVGVEPELGNVVSSAARARRLLDEIGSDRIRIVLDPANLAERGGGAERQAGIAEAIALVGDRVAMAHAKDRTADGGFVAPGKGAIVFTDFIGALRAAGFDGDLVTHGLEAGEAAEAARFLKAASGSAA